MTVTESKITELLPENFVFVVYGCLCDKTHYLAIFAKFMEEETDPYYYILVGFTRFSEQFDLVVDTHFELIDIVLNVYAKILDNNAEVIGDKCCTNRNLAFYLNC